MPPKVPPNKSYVFYKSFGCDIRQANDPTQFVGTCPFCAADDHFFVSKHDPLFHCQRCGRQGNVYTFLGEIIREGLALTSPEKYAELAHNRGFRVETLQAAGLCVSPLKPGTWLIPSRNEKGVLNNVYQANPIYVDSKSEGNGQATRNPPRLPPRSTPAVPPRRPPSSSPRRTPPPRSGPGQPPSRSSLTTPRVKYEIRSAPSPCQQQLYGLDLLRDQKTVLLVEGHWDRLAMWEMLASLAPINPAELRKVLLDMHLIPRPGNPDYHSDLMHQVAVLGSPGASTFKAEWCKHLKGRHLIILYDNDPDRVICPTCRGKEGYKAHLFETACPMCGGTDTTGVVINPGRTGTDHVLKELGDTGVECASIMRINWRTTDPKDMRDLVCLETQKQ